MLLIPALEGRGKQISESRVSLVYNASSWTETQRNLQEKQNRNKPVPSHLVIDGFFPFIWCLVVATVLLGSCGSMERKHLKNEFRLFQLTLRMNLAFFSLP